MINKEYEKLKNKKWLLINRYWSDVYSTALRETTDQSSLASLELIQMSSKKLNLNHLL